jgi:hypothetical protein
MIEDLREQAIQADDVYEQEEKGRFAQFQFLLDLKPQQRLVLAILLFLNTALCGCMVLVMMGRVMPSF